jgi:hydroxymethylpyrimidine pyrophosphatase-like HAD family hydrolase
MRYFALACDYDGTIAKDGRVDADTLAALRQVSASGRRLILVTGRELDELKQTFPEIDIFDWVVAENGALLYEPRTKEESLVCAPVRDDFVAALVKRKIKPLSRGRVIVATWQPNETAVLETIRDLGLELQVVFNKGAVMVLPSGINKASGLSAALKRLSISPHSVVAIGDAENDHAFLSLCEVSAAVANALPTVKDTADFASRRDHGAGVRDLISRLLKDDLAGLSGGLKRNGLVLGTTARGADVRLPNYGSNVLFVGSSGGGKSTLAKTLIERLYNLSYQFCVIDPEGDFEDFEAGVVLGDRSTMPTTTEVLQVLGDPSQNAVVNLLGVPMGERPAYFAALLGGLLELRARTGRPHWIIVDEAHHVLPRENKASVTALPQQLSNVVFISFTPEAILPEALAAVSAVFAVGDTPFESITAFADAVGEKPPVRPRGRYERGKAIYWQRRSQARIFNIAPTRFEHRRHRRKYAEGDVGEEHSFFFNGQERKLNLKAQNLVLFAQIAAGIDDETWTYHLRRGDYSRWFRDIIKDDDLADETAAIEARRRLLPERTRQLVGDAMAKRYALPGGANPASGHLRSEQ